METIPGSFVDETTKALRWHRISDFSMHGYTARRYMTEVADGNLHVMVGHEPAGTDGRLIWHLSMSHPTRLPTWDELKHAKYRLVPADVAMVIIFPRKSVPYVNSHQHTLHLWESQEQSIDR